MRALRSDCRRSLWDTGRKLADDALWRGVMRDARRRPPRARHLPTRRTTGPAATHRLAIRPRVHQPRLRATQSKDPSPDPHLRMTHGRRNGRRYAQPTSSAIDIDGCALAKRPCARAKLSLTHAFRARGTQAPHDQPQPPQHTLGRLQTLKILAENGKDEHTPSPCPVPPLRARLAPRACASALVQRQPQKERPG